MPAIQLKTILCGPTLGTHQPGATLDVGGALTQEMAEAMVNGGYATWVTAGSAPAPAAAPDPPAEPEVETTTRSRRNPRRRRTRRSQ